MINTPYPLDRIEKRKLQELALVAAYKIVAASVFFLFVLSFVK